MNGKQAKQWYLSIILVVVLSGCSLKAEYKPIRTTHAGICYERYIEGHLISDACYQSVRYGNPD